MTHFGNNCPAHPDRLCNCPWRSLPMTIPYEPPEPRRINDAGLVFVSKPKEEEAMAKLQESGDKPYLLLVKTDGSSYSTHEFETLEEALTQYPNQYALDVIIVKRLTLKVQEV